MQSRSLAKPCLLRGCSQAAYTHVWDMHVHVEVHVHVYILLYVYCTCAWEVHVHVHTCVHAHVYGTCMYMYVYLLDITKQRCCIEWFVSRLYNYVHFPCTYYKDIDVHVYGTCMYIYTCTGHCVCTHVGEMNITCVQHVCTYTRVRYMYMYMYVYMYVYKHKTCVYM